MTAVFILIIIFAVLFLISLVKIYVIAEYNNKLVLTIKVLFFKYVFKTKEKSPKNNKKNKPKNKNKKQSKKTNKKPKENSKKEKNSFLQLLKKQGVRGLIDILKDVLNLVTGTIKYFFKHFIVYNLDVRITISEEDASRTAIEYGEVSSVVYPLVSRLAYSLNVKDYTVDVNCNFDENSKTQANCYMKASVRIIFLIILALKLAVKAFKTYIKMKFR
jgi:Ca2+/Na+ antiporter